MLYKSPNNLCLTIIQCVRKPSQVLTLITVLTIFISTTIFAQRRAAPLSGPFQLSGKLSGRDTGNIVLWFPDTSNSWIRDTSHLLNGTFTFNGYISGPSFAHLTGSKGDGNYASFFLEPSLQTISLEENKFNNIKMTGSKTQKENELLARTRAEIMEEAERCRLQIISLEESLKSSSDSIFMVSTQNQLDALKEKMQELNEKNLIVSINFIKTYPYSYVCPTELQGLLYRLPVDSVTVLYKTLSAKVKASYGGQQVWTAIQKRKRLTAGNFLSQFTGRKVNGKEFSLSTFKGKYVLLDFWASWCVPCRKAISEIKEFYSNYHQRGFEVIAISLDRDVSAWKKAIEKDGTGSWTHILRSDEMEYFRTVQEIPQSVLLDRSGKIIWSSFDENSSGWQERLRRELEKK
jgi:thiol-disulfide isomerase/thioredoxin